MDYHNNPDRGQDNSRLLKSWIGITALILMAVALMVLTGRQEQSEDISLPDLANAVEAGEVESIIVQGDYLVVVKSSGASVRARKETGVSAFETLQWLGVSEETLQTTPMVIQNPGMGLGGLLAIVLTLGPLLVVGYFLYQYARQMQGGMFKRPGDIGRSHPRVISAAAEKGERVEQPHITFDDVAGSEEAKLELQEVVEFLKEPGKFIKLGARTPKGVLMTGPPGTGKTLMARAVAGEAGAPFFSISGSEFVEMYVGLGAARVRDLFQRAREQAPAVVFIDELDAVGRRRGTGLGGGNDEREQTLNQILVEMDGFDTVTNVIVIAATNRPDILDAALTRPGRFDRKVTLDRPDVQARQAILGVHTRGMPLAEDVNMADLAKLTPGFVGADLENLVNEAAILTARRDLNRIGQREFQDAMERVIAGPERKGHILSAQERETVAYHEAGHAVVMHHLENCDPVHKVSIISRGTALGYTMPLPESDKYLRSRKAFEDEIVGLLGGRAAEELIFRRVTTGAANDLEQATKLARAMVTRYGFSARLGLRTFGEEQGNLYLGSLGEARDYSEQMAQVIDQEIHDILDAAYRRTREIVTEQQPKLEALAHALLEVETVEREQFEALMNVEVSQM
ncbi:MAG: ATP-dependent zinc metalloprotease FtsH [Anaerolineae bacterium]|jgi:cell division protease FtsH